MALSHYNRDPFFYGGFNEFFAPSPFITRDPMFDGDLMPVLPDSFDRGFNDMVLRHSSPGYEINENDDTYQISMNLPGVRASDTSARLEEDGSVLHVSGGRHVEKDGKMMETRFDKRFTIGDNVDATKLTANFHDGVLTLTAPKTKKKGVEPMQIQITENKKIEDEKKE